MTMRVLFPFVGDSVGGSHLATLALINHLDLAKFEPVVVLDRDGPLARKFDAAGLDHTVVPLGRLAGETSGIADVFFALFDAAPKAARFLRENEIDLVHTNDLRCHLTWGPIARLSGRRWVWHLHQLLSGSVLWMAPTALADRILAVSPQAADSAPALARGRTTVLPNGFDFGTLADRQAAKAGLASEIGIEAGRPIVAYVGNMTRQKRPAVFAAAAVRVAAALAEPPCFVLVGDDRGGERAEIERSFAQAGLSAHVRFLGYRERVPELLSGVDVLAAPGVGDSFGRTLVEALSVGTPVVASRSGGHSFIVADGETGVLVEPDDPDALARGLLKVLDDEELARGLGKSGERDVRSRFDAAAIAKDVMAVYDSLFVT